MLTLEKVRWKNLLSTGNAFQEVDLLAAKKTLITGENGTGKSTLIEALCLALYNKPFFRKNVKRALLVNSIINKNLLIEVEFWAGGHSYLLRRGIKPNVFEIYRDQELIEPPADLKDYQRWLEERVLRMNFRSFTQIVVLGSRNFIPFMQLDAADRRDVIEDLLNIKIFSIMNVMLRQRIEENNIAVDLSKKDVQSIEAQIELNTKRLATFAENNALVVAAKENEITALNHRKDEISAEGFERDKERMTLARRLHIGFSEQAITVSEEIKKQLWNKAQIEKARLFLDKNDICPSCGQNIEPDYKEKHFREFEEEMIMVLETLATLRRNETEHRRLEKENKEIELEITKIDGNMRQLTQEVKMIAWQIKTIQDEIVRLEQDNIKPDDITLELDQKKKEVLAQRETVLNSQKTLQEAGLLLKDSGVKAKVVQQYIPWLNDTINNYLQELDLFVTFKMDEQFRENIRYRGTDDFVYENLSEGEKIRLDLALLFAWRDLRRKQNSTAINILVFDEILDSSLDNTGIDDLLKVLDRLTAKENVLIISHKDMPDKFDRTLHFEKVMNFSQIKEA